MNPPSPQCNSIDFGSCFFCVQFRQPMLPRSRPKAPSVMPREAGLWETFQRRGGTQAGPHRGEKVLLPALNAGSKQSLSLLEKCSQVLNVLPWSIYKGGCDTALGRKPLCGGVMAVIFYQTGHPTHRQISFFQIQESSIYNFILDFDGQLVLCCRSCAAWPHQMKRACEIKIWLYSCISVT